MLWDLVCLVRFGNWATWNGLLFRSPGDYWRDLSWKFIWPWNPVEQMRLGQDLQQCRVKVRDPGAWVSQHVPTCPNTLCSRYEYPIISQHLAGWTLDSNSQFADFSKDQHGSTMVLFLNLDGGCQVVSTEIIDDDAFPGNKHREEIEKGEDAIWNISGFSLFWEFFRLNFIRNSDHHWRIIGESLVSVDDVDVSWSWM